MRMRLFKTFSIHRFYLGLVALAVVPVAMASAQSLAITHPNGRERFEVGDTIPIEWQSQSAADLVRLHFSADGGVSWSLITDRAVGGRYRWVVPSVQTGDAFIRAERWQPDTVVGSLEFPRARGVYKAAFVTPDGDRVVIGQLLPGHPADSEIQIYDATSAARVATRSFRGRSVFDADASPDGRHLYLATLATSASDTSVVVLDVDSAAVVGGLRGHSLGAASVDASADGRLLATGGYGPELRIWDVETMQTIKEIDGFNASVGHVAFDPTSRFLAAAAADTVGIRVFDVGTWQQKHVFVEDANRTRYGEVRDIEFASDGRRLLSVSYPYGISIFDVEDGRQLLRRVAAPGTSLAAFSPDGRTVASGRDTVYIWDASSGNTLFKLPRVLPGLAQISFSPDGAELLTLGKDSIPRLWQFGGKTIESDQSDRSWGIGTAAGVVERSTMGTIVASVTPDTDANRVVVRLGGMRSGSTSVTIVDILGRVVARASVASLLQGEEAAIDVEGIVAGAYFAHVRAGDATAALPFVWRP